MTEQNPTVGFAIPTIAPRGKMLRRAVKSIQTQTYPVDQISICVDTRREGAAMTRNRAKSALVTDWTCFLDDDDELYQFHVGKMIECARETGADVVYPWFDVVGGTDPWPERFQRPWDPEHPYLFPITAMIRTELAQAVDFPTRETYEGQWEGEDWPFWKAVFAMGATVAHAPYRTWRWYHHTGNTSGIPENW